MTDNDLSLTFAALTALGTLAVPIVVAIMAARFNSQVQKWEASQWRNQELIKARLQYYRDLVPLLNDLMCYFTFIGTWKELTPPKIIEIKRQLDRDFHCAAPLFGEEIAAAYSRFTDRCFETFGEWGADARLRTGFGQRRRSAGTRWDPAWDLMFSYDGVTEIPASELIAVRTSYSDLIAHFARDIELNVARDRYVNADVAVNAH